MCAVHLSLCRYCVLGMTFTWNISYAHSISDVHGSMQFVLLVVLDELDRFRMLTWVYRTSWLIRIRYSTQMLDTQPRLVACRRTHRQSGTAVHDF